MKFSLFVCSLMLPFFLLRSQASDRRADLEYLRESLVTYHPALTKYNPDFLSQANELLNQDLSDLNQFGFNALVNRMVAVANEGHFRVSVDREGIHAGFFNNSFLYLPLSVRVLEDGIYAWGCLTKDCDLRKGDKIISINGRSAQELIAEMGQYVSCDGKILTNVRHQLTNTFASDYYLFIERPASFTIRYRRQSGVEISKTILPAVDRQRMVEFVRNQPKDTLNGRIASSSGNEVYHMEIVDDSAFLTLHSFSRQKLESQKIKAKKLYETLFRKIAEAGVRNLVVDLRGNGGGMMEMVQALLPYLIRSHFGEVYQSSQSWEGKRRTYKLPGKPAKYHFDGPLYVLVDGHTFSSGSTLARYLREYAGATTVGEETATRYEGFVAGSDQIITLPHSGIKIKVWRWHKSFPDSRLQSTTNRGLIPDHIVTIKIDDLIENRDPFLDKVRRLLNTSD